ncbi:hypothetical protein H0H92_001379 [Tricholoma furcatifolium]|nr:hypothetical protein H0H92_001379 [Tricholoma furcatifolium]
MAEQRQRIIASVFSRRNATGGLEETYVSHVKIWEDAGPEGGGRKPRYILLSQASNGSGFIHKSKLNTNGTFSVGKTWRLPELRAVHVVNNERENDALAPPTTQLHRRAGSTSRAPSPSIDRSHFTTTNSRDSSNNQSPSVNVQVRSTESPSPFLRSSNADNIAPTANLQAPPRSERPPLSADAGSAMLSPLRDPSHHSRPPSPASFRSRKQSLQNVAPPMFDTPRRDHNARISFYDPANQATLDRLISEGGINIETEGEDENASATIANVEDMIEGYEWASDDVITRKSSRGAADLIEARLLDELLALEKSVSDDIVYIQSQNRGLQVQTQNQRALLSELENLMQTVNVDQQSLVTLTQESLEKPQSMERLEEAAAQLYKALQAGRDTDMAATMERLQEYRTHNVQFCKRMYDFLSIMFTAQSTLLLGDTNGLKPATGRTRPSLVPHQEMEAYLGRYSGLMLYLKEMDESVYAKLCAAYFSATSGLHSVQIKNLFSTYATFVKKAPEESHDHGFSSTSVATLSKGAVGMRRAGTIIRSPMETRNKDREKISDGDSRASEIFGLALSQIAPAINSENEFITDFLQINEAGLTFADYMGLDSYFRRQAARAPGLSQATLKLVRGAMDLIFGFLPTELKTWLDTILEKDKMEVIGIIARLERFLSDPGEKGDQYLPTLLEKQHTRLRGMFERHIKEQMTDIEQTKLSSKKRQGVAHFVKHFPAYVGQVENQLIGADGLEIRATVDAAYEKIVQSIFDSLKQMAKMDGEGEDKGQLNYHVILIENMHYFVAETSVLEVGSVNVFCRQAEAIYDENLSAYTKIVLRRPFAKIIVSFIHRMIAGTILIAPEDYFEGVERLLKTTTPTEIASNSIYSKSALRKVVREYNSKDLRKHIDALFVRVGKHFAEASEKAISDERGGIVPGTVLVRVWKACEEELLRITDLFNKRITQCYSETGVVLEYSAADVEAAFKRHRVTS